MFILYNVLLGSITNMKNHKQQSKTLFTQDFQLELTKLKRWKPYIFIETYLDFEDDNQLSNIIK